jgi:hypothetical protein
VIGYGVRATGGNVPARKHRQDNAAGRKVALLTDNGEGNDDKRSASPDPLIGLILVAYESNAARLPARKVRVQQSQGGALRSDW